MIDEAIAWSPVIRKDDPPQPVTVMYGTLTAVKYDFRIALSPISTALFKTFLQATELTSHSFNYHKREDWATAMYCTEVFPFCAWLHRDYQQRGWLEAGWQIDLPTSGELGLGVSVLPVNQTEQIWMEWYWRDYVATDYDDCPPEYRNTAMQDYHLILSRMGKVFALKGRHGFSDLSPTWDDKLGFRVVMRQITP